LQPAPPLPRRLAVEMRPGGAGLAWSRHGSGNRTLFPEQRHQAEQAGAKERQRTR
jgi:hypothetical protein